MKTIIRNLLSVLLRFKMATLLNVLGLSVAFAAFMLIMKQLDYDWTFDKGHANSDRIYRVELSFPSGSVQAVICRPLTEAFAKSSPHIVASGLRSPFNNKRFFTVEEGGERNGYMEPMEGISPEFTQVFDFKMVEGSPDALREPNTGLIPESIARKVFGDRSAIGKRLQTGEQLFLIVGGVYKDFPPNTSVGNSIYWAIDPKENANSWNNWNYLFYIRVNDPANAAGLFENFMANLDDSSLGPGFSFDKSEAVLRLTPLAEVHYVTDVMYDSSPKASRQILLVLFAIAFVIVVIAGINFTNFSTALAPMRVKSINTQKVLGGEEAVIRLALVLEAVMISLLSFLLSLFLVHVAGLTGIASLVDADISLAAHKGIVALTGGMAICVGLLAGVYPAYYMTSFPPALVLKGSFGLSPKGRKLRGLLIGVQFMASFGLIIGAIFMYLQNHYMQNTPLGYEKDEIIVTDLNSRIRESKEAFVNQLRGFSGIDGVTFAEPLLSSKDQYMGWGRLYRGENINFQCLPVDPSFLDMMGITVEEGRGFREEDKNSSYGVYVFNQKARDTYGMELGSMIDSAEIVGFMPDVKFASFRTEVSPMAFYVWGKVKWGSPSNYAYIKVKAGSGLRDAMGHVKETLRALDPEFMFDVRFFDEVINRLYEKEHNLSALITLFSLIAIFISMVGVFGLVVFDSEYRKKEIGIRKVLGSSTTQIIVMFNKGYVCILSLCFLVAAPLAGYGVSRWLENFAYKTPMYWWVYLVAFLLVFTITILTVTFQNWHAANENPVKSIKTE